MAGEAEAQIEEILGRQKSDSDKNQDTFADVASSFDPLGIGPDFHSKYAEQLAQDMEKAKLNLQLQQYKDAKNTAAENKANWKGAYGYIFGKGAPGSALNDKSTFDVSAPTAAPMGAGAGMGGNAAANKAAYEMLMAGKPEDEEKGR